MTTTTEHAELGNGWTMSPDRKTLLWVSDPVHVSDGTPGGWRDLMRISRTFAHRDGKPIPAILIATADWWADDADTLNAGPDRDVLLDEKDEDDTAAYMHAVDWSGIRLPNRGGLAMLVYTLGVHLTPDTWMDVAMKVGDVQLPRFDKEADELHKLLGEQP